MTTDYIPEELLWRLMDCMCPGNAVALMLMVANRDAYWGCVESAFDSLVGRSEWCFFLDAIQRIEAGKDRVIRVPAAVAAALRTLPRGKSPWLFP